MFDPIIFDNIKVVLEGAVYDRDLAGQIAVTARADLVDLAAYGREYRITFCLAEDKEKKDAVSAQIALRTTLLDIASEQLEMPVAEQIGCTICVHFMLHVADWNRETRWITSVLDGIWGDRPHITQYIGTRLDEHRSSLWPPERYENKVTLDFHRKIGEGNIEDLYELVEHCVASVARLRDGMGGS
ncbi:hypothetical protein LOK74_01470 [Brevibacillus humidisoli]|nr:hypothetical protein [Brevibacillus humidisoli]UFJ43189.1 hypothetical protein LOK74_01470 [Brevibacillus humidisoli]